MSRVFTAWPQSNHTRSMARRSRTDRSSSRVAPLMILEPPRATVGVRRSPPPALLDPRFVPDGDTVDANLHAVVSRPHENEVEPRGSVGFAPWEHEISFEPTHPRPRAILVRFPVAERAAEELQIRRPSKIERRARRAERRRLLESERRVPRIDERAVRQGTEQPIVQVLAGLHADDGLPGAPSGGAPAIARER